MIIKSKASIIRILKDKYFIDQDYNLCSIVKQTNIALHYNYVTCGLYINTLDNDFIKISLTDTQINLLNNYSNEKRILITEIYNPKTKSLNIIKIFDKSEITPKSYMVCSKNSIKIINFNFLNNE
jgi:hypothetical protein